MHRVTSIPSYGPEPEVRILCEKLPRVRREEGSPGYHTAQKSWNRRPAPCGQIGMLRVQNRAVMAGLEIYVKIKGRWTYLYRVVDSKGKTVDFLMRAKRDVAAAKAFFRRAFKTQGRLPRAITPVGYQALHRAAREVLGEHRRSTDLQSSKYLNNLIEQDHRSVKFWWARCLGSSDSGLLRLQSPASSL